MAKEPKGRGATAVLEHDDLDTLEEPPAEESEQPPAAPDLYAVSGISLDESRLSVQACHLSINGVIQPGHLVRLEVLALVTDTNFKPKDRRRIATCEPQDVRLLEVLQPEQGSLFN